jgi:hypothetical protein
MIDLNLPAVAAEMRRTLIASNGERRCAARGLPSGQHLTLFRTPDRSFPSVFHYRLEVATHHIPPFTELLDRTAEAFGAAYKGEWTVRGGITNEGLRLWTAWRCWFEDEGEGGAQPADAEPAHAEPAEVEPS